MDANGTRYHLLLGEENWSSCTVDTEEHKQIPLGLAWTPSLPDSKQAEFEWDAQRAAFILHLRLSSKATELEWDVDRYELTLRARVFEFPTPPKGLKPTLSNRRGADHDRYGNWYWIDETNDEIRVNSVGTGVTTHFWSVGDGVECEPSEHAGDFRTLEPKPSPPPLQLSGLAVTEDHYLVVGVLHPAGLLIFDLYAGGAPRQVIWPATVTFVPFDMAAAPGGGVWILDRESKRYWGLDRQLNVIRQDQVAETLVPDDFQPAGGGFVRQTATRAFPGSFALSAPSPVAIEALPDGTVLILDNSAADGFSRLYRYHLSQPLGQPISANIVLNVIDDNPAFRLLGYDFAFVPEHNAGDAPDQLYKVPDQLYIVAADCKQTFAFLLSQQNDQLDMQPIAEYLPMRLFGGKGLVATSEQAYYDFADGWIPLVAQPRRRYSSEATCYTPVFDGRVPYCVWHRLMLDACIPHETSVQVWSRAANDEQDLQATPWQQEPRLYLRGDGSELPFVREITTEVSGTWELLFQNARGRYLQLKLSLSGNGRSTPRLRALRAYYPRFSYLERYLPGVYREDSQSASFLDRFLANLEGFNTVVEDKIANVQVLFDARSAPTSALEWLASWFGVAFDQVWSEVRQRLFIKHAMDFFQYRGTIRGLQMALRLTFDECPDETIFTDLPEDFSRKNRFRIVEKYLTRSTPGVVFGDPTDLIGPRLISPAELWRPELGGSDLIQRYRKFLHQQGLDVSQVTSFPITAPTNSAFNAAWQQFSRYTLGFVPGITAADLQLWQDFLARRYRSISTFNDAYLTSWDFFEGVLLPSQLPQDGAPLVDWFQFESVVLAMRHTAHRFTVLLPVPSIETVDEYQRQLDLTKRIIELEKPAHTVFDVKFYWALFRVGEARLGEDTLLGLGGRVPQLMPPVVLGQGYLSESYLAPGFPQDTTQRQILGREQLNR